MADDPFPKKTILGLTPAVIATLVNVFLPGQVAGAGANFRYELAALSDLMTAKTVLVADSRWGVKFGALADDAAREANYAALQAVADYASSNGLMLQFPPGAEIQVKGGRTILGQKLGVQFGKGVLGFFGNHCTIKQFDGSQLAYYLGEPGDDYTYGARFHDLAAEYGVDGGVDSIGIGFGSHNMSQFINLGVTPHSGFKPKFGWKQCSGNLFDCLILNLGISVAKTSYCDMRLGGSGNVFIIAHFGSGNPDNLQELDGPPVIFQDMLHGTYIQINVEHTVAGAMISMDNCSCTILQAVHIEDCRPVGADPCFIRLYWRTTGSILIKGLQLFENDVKSEFASNSCSVISIGGGAGVSVEGFETRHRADPELVGGVNRSMFFFKADDGPLEQGNLARCEARSVAISENNRVCGFYMDPTCRPTEGAEFASMRSCGSYTYFRGRSTIREPVLVVDDSWTSNQLPLFGIYENPMVAVEKVLEADLEVYVRRTRASFGPGALSPTRAGNLYDLYRAPSATGAYEVRFMREIYPGEPDYVENPDHPGDPNYQTLYALSEPDTRIPYPVEWTGVSVLTYAP